MGGSVGAHESMWVWLLGVKFQREEERKKFGTEPISQTAMSVFVAVSTHALLEMELLIYTSSDRP